MDARAGRVQGLIELEAAVAAPNYAPLPVVLERGEGSWLWDADGRRYLDFMSAYSAVSHGHAHPRLVRALVEQAQGNLAGVANVTIVESALAQGHAAGAPYDLVIIDTPPILAVTDATLVGRQAGTCLLVARFGLTTIKEIEANQNTENLALESTKLNDNLVSETFAKILIKQGKKEMAKEIYEKLGLKFPDKRTYFADLIEKLKE